MLSPKQTARFSAVEGLMAGLGQVGASICLRVGTG